VHHDDSTTDQRRQLTVIVSAFALLTVAGTVGFMLIEGWNVIDAFYMTVITVSTVGFREVHTMSPAGRVFASFVILAGVSMAVYTFTRLGQFVLAGELMDVLGRRRMKSVLDKLERHFIICGYGRIGKPVAEGMKRDELPFCVIDRDTKNEGDMRSRGYVYILGDSTDEDILRAAGVERAAALLALLPSDADNLYLTMTAKSLNPGIRVIARGRDERAEMKLKRGGADRVVSPYLMAAARVLSAAAKPMVVEFMELVTHRQHLPLRLEEISVTDRSGLSGHSLAETEIRARFRVIVVAIKKSTGEMLFNPDPGQTIVSGDVLIAMGEEEDLEKLEQACMAGT
jgi:voltage-gated potassium channel